MIKVKANDLLNGVCIHKKSSRYDYEKTSVDFNSLNVGTNGSYKESR